MDDTPTQQDRKRRDSADDAKGAPVYTGEPLPPFISMMEDLVYIAYRADPDRLRTLLPAGLTPTDPTTVIGCLYRHGTGWGLSHVSAAFLSIAVREFAAADTSEACFIPLGWMEEPGRSLFAQHYAALAEGTCTITVAGDTVTAEVAAAGQPILRCRMRTSGEVSRDMAANDRYLGLNAAGELVSTVGSVIGDCLPGDLLELTILPGAPERLQALAPGELVWAGLNPRLLLSWAAPEPIRLDSASAEARAGRAVLLDLMDRQSRATVIVSDQGRVLMTNSEANRLLGQAAAGQRAALRPLAEEATAFREALCRAGEGRLPVGRHRFRLPRPGRIPLLMTVAPVDPALAGPGTALLLLSDPEAMPDPGDAQLFQLLGLTPAEARIAAAISAGLAPRAAAEYLGLAESTVRSSLKVVFAKLGVTRQADLVRLAVGLSVPIR